MNILKNLLALILGLFFSLIFLLVLEFSARLTAVQHFFSKTPMVMPQETTDAFQTSVSSFLSLNYNSLLYSKETLTMALEEGIDRDFGSKGTLRISPKSIFHQKISSHQTKTVIVESVTTYDDYARRKTEVRPDSKFNLFLLGGSFTLGHFVNDQDNFPHLLSTKLNDFQVYNMGIGGGAPNLILYDLEGKINPLRWQNIPKRESIAIYTFIDDHINRVICRIECYASQWMLELPYYREKNGSFVEDGINQDHLSHVDQMMLQLFAGSSLIKLLKLNYPLQLNDNDYARFARLVGEVKKRIDSHHLLKDFYVILFPGMSSHYGRRLVPFFQRHKIKTIDLSHIQFEERIKTQLSIPGDGHPSPLMHRLMAQIIAEQLK